MKKILVVEDDPSMLNSIVDILQIKDDYEIYKAAAGKEALQSAVKVTPDLILSDIMLPDFTGYQLLEKIKNFPELSFVPFIFLTAKAELTDIRRGMSKGADDYLTKPFKARDLLEAIEIRLKKNEVLKQKSAYAEDEIDDNITDEDNIKNDWLLVKDKDEINFVKIPDIVTITANSDYSEILINGKKQNVRKSLKSWEKTLEPYAFLRIHRSTIINLDFVEKFEKASNNSFILKMKGMKDVFVVSRRYAAKIKPKMVG